MLRKLPQVFESLEGELAPIRQVAERFIGSDAEVDKDTGALLLSRRPAIGSEAFACVLFPGLPPDAVKQYEETEVTSSVHFHVSPGYKRVLYHLNGASLFGIHLFGLPDTMRQNPPLLNRSVRQPLDLGAANTYWRRPYKADPAQFHFGGGPLSYKENVGYFLNPDESVEVFRSDGRRIWSWTSIVEFLNHELPRAESLFEPVA
jgi:hypothetical protein